MKNKITGIEPNKGPRDSSLMENLSRILLKLKEQLSGHVSAYNDLLDKTASPQLARLYSQFAENEWEKVYKADPDDWVACHHLAIMYHAQAFDLEAKGEFQKASKHWKRAHKYWHQLFRMKQPLTAIHTCLKTWKDYRSETHASVFETLEQNLIRDLLQVHYQIYKLSLFQDSRRAAMHYDIIETSPFDEKKMLLRSMYQETMGQQVWDFIKKVGDVRTGKNMIKLLPKLTALQQKVQNACRDKTEQSAMIRDRVLLESMNLKIGMAKCMNFYMEKIEPNIKSIDQLDKKLNQQEIEIRNYMEDNIGDEQAFQLKAKKFNALVKERNQLFNVYNQNREIFYAMLKDMEEKILNTCEQKLSALNVAGNANDLNEAVRVFQESIVEAKRRFWAKENIPPDSEEYRFVEAMEKSEKLAGSYIVTDSPPEGNQPFARVLPKGIWHWTSQDIHDIPYRNTCFLLLEEELPAFADFQDVNPQIRKLVLKKKKLEPKAKAKKHVVLGNKVKPATLNAVEQRLKDPGSLACDMVLQHQAHHLNLKDILEQLEAVEPLNPENIKLEMSPSLFDLLKRPPKHIRAGNSWTRPTHEPEIPGKPEIKWPV